MQFPSKKDDEFKTREAKALQAMKEIYQSSLSKVSNLLKVVACTNFFCILT